MEEKGGDDIEKRRRRRGFFFLGGGGGGMRKKINGNLGMGDKYGLMRVFFYMKSWVNRPKYMPQN